MKTGEDFRREFPAADAGFTAAAGRSLAGIDEAKASKARKYRMTALLAAIVLLLISTAFAADAVRKNAGDFIREHPYANLNIEADAALSGGFEAELLFAPYATFQMKQAVYDGMAVYLLLECVPKEAGYMIVPGLIQEEGQAFSHGTGYPADMGITEYAAQQGYSGVQPVLIFGDEITSCYYDSAMNEDGSCSLMVWAFVRPEYRELDQLALHLWVEDAQSGVPLSEGRLAWEVSLPLAGKVQRTVSIEPEPVVLDGTGVAINSVTAIRTAMTTYIITDFDVIDAAVYQQSLFNSGRLRYLSEAGEPLPKGTHPLSIVVGRTKQHMGDQTQHITNREMDADCSEIIISVEGGESHTFLLQ